MKSRLSTPQAYVSSSVYMYKIGTVGLSDHAVRPEVADMVQKHIQIAVSHGSIFRLLQNAHIQAFENPSATVSTPSQGHQAEEGMSGKDSDQKMSATCLEALNQDATDPDHLEENILKERRCSEDRKRVYSIGWVIKRRVCPHTPVVEGVSHITVAAETPKATIKVPAHEEWSPLLRGIIIERILTSSMEDEDLSQPWVYEETNPFTPRIRYFDLPKRIQWWAMPMWCHMFNSTLTGNARVWFDNLLPESINSFDDLKEAFLANYLQQKKCIKDPVEIHHIKQREGESMEDFVRRFKIESRDVKGALLNVEDNHSFPQRRSGSWQLGTKEDIFAMEAARYQTQTKFQEMGL
ncbi:reverse transcriptase domain-containing protein [Tanacetum coccineum]